MQASVGVKRVHQAFKANAEFLCVYLREAHPSDGWTMRDWSTVRDPRTHGERCGVATKCTKKVGFAFPTIVDEMDDRAGVAWAAWPERLYVIGKDGRIAYASKRGPFGFWPTDAFKRPGWVRRVGDGPSLETFLTARYRAGKRREL